MGLFRSPNMRSGDYLEGMINDYVGGKARLKANKSASASANASARLVAALTCLQFAFAVYATFLIYYMSPAVDLRTKPDFTWATKIAKSWKEFMITPHFVGHYQEAASLVKAEIQPITAVCDSNEVLASYVAMQFASLTSLRRKSVVGLTS